MDKYLFFIEFSTVMYKITFDFYDCKMSGQVSAIKAAFHSVGLSVLHSCYEEDCMNKV